MKQPVYTRARFATLRANPAPDDNGMNQRQLEPSPTGEVESPRNRKLYLSRLKECGVPEEPSVSQPARVEQFQLAQLAVTLACRGTGDRGPSELAGVALQFWNAAGNALRVEEQAQVVVKGLLILDRQGWDAHCKALIGLLNDLEGAPPGQHSSQVVCKSHESARKKAAAAVFRTWRGGPPVDELLRALFPGRTETEAKRRAKLLALGHFAREVIRSGEHLPLGTKDGNPLGAALFHAWEPLGGCDGEAFDHAVAQATALVEKPELALTSLIPFNPCVARWLAVLQQDQSADAKRRS